MSPLGIYFGPQRISIVETKGRHVLSNLEVPLSSILLPDPQQEKVPEEIKTATLLKEELRKNTILTNEAYVSLSGKNLIVRTFEMPIMPGNELENAISFEAKKYIPFKLEDLISDFQWKLDKISKKTRVLFVGIKKEALEKHLYILAQSGLKIKSIEYAAFSILRLFKLSNIKEKGIIAVVTSDFVKEDETNFVVLENGFPLFSRDITSICEHEGTIKDKAEYTGSGKMLDKFRREIQISLDYYDRKFPGKYISKIFFITNPANRDDLNGFIKEIGLETQFIDVDEYTEKSIPFSLAFIKAYSGSLSSINTEIKINLLLAKERPLRKMGTDQLIGAPWYSRLSTNAVIAVVCSLICIATFIFGVFRALPLQKELKYIINMRPAVSTIPADLSYEELLKIDYNFKKKIETLDNIIKSRFYLTVLLDALPAIMPKGIQLYELAFKKEGVKIELALEGAAYLGNSKKELELINGFLAHLKQDPAFSKYFKDVSIVSTKPGQVQQRTVTNFKINFRD